MRLLRSAGHGTVVAYAALFIALGGTSYAAFTITSSDQIAPNVINAGHIIDDQITSADVKGHAASGSRPAEDGGLNGNDIRNGTIKTADVADNNVTREKLADNAVNGSKVADGSLTEDDIGGLIVADDSAKLLGLGPDAFLRTDNPFNGDVSGQANNLQLTSGAVQSGDVRDNSLTGDDIDEDTLGKVGHAGTADSVGPAGVTTDALGAQAVTAPKIGRLPVATANSADGVSIDPATWTDVSLPNEDLDSAGLHSTTDNSERFVAPIPGIYEVNARGVWDNKLFDEYRQLAIVVTHGTQDGRIQVAGGPTIHDLNQETVQSGSALVQLSAGDSVRIQVRQDIQRSSGDAAGGTEPRTLRLGTLEMHWVSAP